MFTSYDKFLVALIMAGVEFARARFDVDLPIDEATANGLAGLLTAVLVYLTPNKPLPNKPSA
jgi:hypothetical protein